MAKSPKKPSKQAEIQDEPGAEQRFSNILKRALNTPPKRKQSKDELESLSKQDRPQRRRRSQP